MFNQTSKYSNGVDLWAPMGQKSWEIAVHKHDVRTVNLTLMGQLGLLT
jgi:hypothetical protein